MMMDYATRKKLVELRYSINDRLRINEFIFSRIFILWAIIGLLGGIMAGFYWIILDELTHVLAHFTGAWVIACMTGGGLIAGLIIYLLRDPGEIDLIVNNIRFRGGRLDTRNNPAMILSSLICIASGGSLGPETPMIQVVGSTGTWLAKRLHFRNEDIRSMTIAGVASGFTALFGAPLGSSLFALEILHHKHVTEYYQALIPAIVASCTSYIVFVIITHIGIGPSWQFPASYEVHVNDAFYAIGFGIMAAAVGWAFIFLVRTGKRFFKKLPFPIFVKTTIGGLLLGIMAYELPITRYFSHYQIPELFNQHFTLQLLLAILIVKLLAITVTVTSGWRGGFIIPLFFTGATLGLIISYFFPYSQPALIMVCCMAALNACVTRTPVSSTILVATMTGVHLLIPILFASLTGFFLAPKTPLINAQLRKHEKHEE